jgi:2-aminoethylphosphonate dioxygenase
VSAELQATWDRDGFVVARGLIDEGPIEQAGRDADRVRDEFAHLIDVRNIRCRWQDNVFTGECQFDAFDPIVDFSPAAAALARHPRLLDLLAGIYRDTPRPFKDKLIYKRPGAKGYGLHQDWIAWARFPRSFVSVVIPLDPADEANGCTIVYPGYHRDGPMTSPDGNYHELPVESVDESRAVPLVLAPGDVAVFGGFVPHRSNANLRDTPRRQLYLSFTADADGGDLRDAHYRDFHTWLQAKYAEHGKTNTYYA